MIGFALVPHKVFYMRAGVKDLVSRVVLGRGHFDYWESGMDLRFGKDMYNSFVRYQTRLIRVFDRLSKTYDLEMIDATRPADEIFSELQSSISRLFTPVRSIRKPGEVTGPALTAQKRKTYNRSSSKVGKL
jgi:hypothetical protein